MCFVLNLSFDDIALSKLSASLQTEKIKIDK